MLQKKQLSRASFISGATITIRVSQIKNLLGFHVASNGTLLSYIVSELDNIKETNWISLDCPTSLRAL
ncbi:SulP family inorganic anion transporter [Marinomonas ushuaiensis]|uniref:SulP family inorganic anion transporter n=1 Tax=Marinomonas ushuaiensis TaxID=263818 RepID=UPI003CCB814A